MYSPSLGCWGRPFRPTQDNIFWWVLLQFARLPFGLSTTTTFQRIINMVLAAVLGKHTICYLDNLIIFAGALHFTDLDETVGFLKPAGLKLNLKKCTSDATAINFLWFYVSPEGVSHNKRKRMAFSIFQNYQHLTRSVRSDASFVLQDFSGKTYQAILI